MKLERLVRSGVIAMLFAGAWTMGCGAESPEVPDDDTEDGGTAGTGFPMGGTAGATPTGGTAGTGFPMGGTAGTPPTGGAAGAFPSGGAAGTAPTGGAAGAGTMCLTNNVGVATDLLIDNLEDGNNTVGDDKMPAIRIGYWYTFKDTVATCTIMPAPDMGGASPFVPTLMAGSASSTGARFSGTGCTGPDYGAGMGFDVNNCNAKPNAYNGAAYNGIKFWYKSTTAVRFQIGTMATTPPPNGSCAADCYDHHGQILTAAPAGMDISISFITLNQEFTPAMTMFDKTQILNFQWQIKKEEGAAFDFTVDNIEFTP